ncbi:MAG: GspE/PulE family protein [Patescibacteria group bacterium]
MADLQKIQELLKQNQGSGAQSFSGTQDSSQVLLAVNRSLAEKAVSERAKELNLPYVDIERFPLNPDVLHVLSEDESVKALAVPFFKSGKTVRLAVNDTSSPAVVAVVKKLTDSGYETQLSLASEDGIRSAMRLYHSQTYRLPVREGATVTELERGLYEKELTNLVSLRDKILELSAEEALLALHAGAIKAGASDIHYQPTESECMIRFRIDGILHNVFSLPHESYEQIANQLKYKAKMQLNITTVPQDGRFQFVINDRAVDVRISSLPTEFGESFVCRVLDRKREFMNLEGLGFDGRALDKLKQSTSAAYGMILCTGPTGSGKTTTLYALLSALNTPEKKIITLEDPIEYELTGVVQSQINEKRGYNFATGLRSVLRQDPNVVMIGEIRDLETAETAAQAALTGHVVLSTLHANNAVDTISRLMTMGVTPIVAAPALSVIVGQRLIRRLCVCAEKKAFTEKEKQAFTDTISAIQSFEPSFSVQIPDTVLRAKGCEKCNMIGYRGQTVIAEVLRVTDEIKTAILNGASSAKIFELARAQGMLTVREDGILKVIAGITTLDEVYRVT